MKKLWLLGLMVGLNQAHGQTTNVLLSITPIQVTNQCFIEWVPTPDSAGTGSGYTVATYYTGPAYQISATNLPATTNFGILVESSTNLSDPNGWHGYPSDGFMVTLLTNSESFTTLSDGVNRFYRGRLSELHWD